MLFSATALKPFTIEMIDADASDAPQMCNVLAIGGSTTSYGYTKVSLVWYAQPQPSSTWFLPSSISKAESILSPLTAFPATSITFAHPSSIPYHEPMVIQLRTHRTIRPSPYSPTNVRAVGVGSGSSVLARAGAAILNLNGAYYSSPDFAGLAVLNEGTKQIFFNASMITKWGGEVGASFILESAAFSGWAAFESFPIQVYSTGGRVITH
ncbi:hypothetical protein Moror_10816 [Moniliophthora roreri MCA 2997]|uniref:Uncharacterized protein n=2 Tax=Moniliophthora roreri TaxID=221103 RepID=V2X5E4_MONRO|nr:hypothetical protein Moror_10816 [Moniliophthora roreri MCA 2997]